MSFSSRHCSEALSFIKKSWLSLSPLRKRRLFNPFKCNVCIISNIHGFRWFKSPHSWIEREIKRYTRGNRRHPDFFSRSVFFWKAFAKKDCFCKYTMSACCKGGYTTIQRMTIPRLTKWRPDFDILMIQRLFFLKKRPNFFSYPSRVSLRDFSYPLRVLERTHTTPHWVFSTPGGSWFLV